MIEDRREWPWHPRTYQRELLDALRGGCKRAVCVWHRRAGKDATSFNWALTQALQHEGNYYYFFPTYAQGKKIFWLGIDAKGKRFLDYIPPECVIGDPHETDMLVKLRTFSGGQSTFQVVGTDNCDSIVGTNPRGCIFSEYSLQNPTAWDLVRPILNENKGWAIFLYTPRGRNHGYTLYNAARSEEDWFVSMRDVTMTFRDSEGEDGSPVITEEDIESERRMGMDPDLIQQEYYCSFRGQMQGSYFGSLVQLADDQDRICSVPWNANRPVYTVWDIGMGDANSIWFYQYGEKDPVTGKDFRGYLNFIDYLEDSGKALPYYVEELHKLGYAYRSHLFPHDIKQREYTTGVKRLAAARKMLKSVRVGKKVKVDEQIDMTRRIFHLMRFDSLKCEKGVNALASFKKKWDEERQCYSKAPLHDWSSHGASAMMTLAVNFTSEDKGETIQVVAESEFDPLREDSRHPTQYGSEFDPMRDPIERPPTRRIL